MAVAVSCHRHGPAGWERSPPCRCRDGRPDGRRPSAPRRLLHRGGAEVKFPAQLAHGRKGVPRIELPGEHALAHRLNDLGGWRQAIFGERKVKLQHETLASHVIGTPGTLQSFQMFFWTPLLSDFPIKTEL